MSPWLEIGFTSLTLFVVLVGVLHQLVYLGCLFPAWRELVSNGNSYDAEAAFEALREGKQPSVTLIVPAFNEGKTVVANAHSLLSLRYAAYDVVIVNDGSKDDTLDQLTRELSLKPIPRATNPALQHAEIRQVYRSEITPNLLVIDKENGGKADAINAGLACTRSELFCVIDADSILQPEALARAVRPFQEAQSRVIAVGGTVGVANGCTVRYGQILRYQLPAAFLPRVQAVEYTRAFLVARLAASRSNTLALVSGAFGVFRTRDVIEAGAYDSSTVGEDMELIVRLHRHFKDAKRPYTIRYLPEPVCWTEVPSTWKGLMRQRVRWQRGALQTLARHTDMVLKPRYGRFGMISLPLMVLIDVIGPVVEVLGYLLVPLAWALGLLNLPFFLAYLAVTFVFGIFLSCSAILLEQSSVERPTTARQLVRLAWTSVLENFGYRQISNVWRLIGLVRHLRAAPARWDSVGRVGFR